MRSTKVTAVVVLSLGLLAGCGPEIYFCPYSSTLEVTGADEYTNLDEFYAELARRVPGFGGAYAEGGLMMAHFLVPTAGAAQALEQEWIALAGSIPFSPVVALQGDYDWLELFEIRRRVDENWSSLDGLFSTDIDELRNRVAFGFLPGSDLAAAEELLGSLSVELDAVILEWGEPPELDAC